MGLGVSVNDFDERGCIFLYYVVILDIDGKCLEYLLRNDVNLGICDK